MLSLSMLLAAQKKNCKGFPRNSLQPPEVLEPHLVLQSLKAQQRLGAQCGLQGAR